MEDKFNSFKELVENVSRGGEVEFIYGGKKYSITHPEGRIHVLEQYNYNSVKVYDDPVSIGEFLIGDKALKDIITDAEILFRCF